jgi:hypothetical protein
VCSPPGSSFPLTRKGMIRLSFKYELVPDEDIQCLDTGYIIRDLIVTYGSILGQEVHLPIDYTRLKETNPALYDQIEAHKLASIREQKRRPESKVI